MQRSTLLPAALMTCLLAHGCQRTLAKPDAGKAGPISAEQRFGNDLELVADFNNLQKCDYKESRLDRTCPQIAELNIRLETKQRTAKKRERLVTTLANLLESKKERTRLMAAASLFPHLTQPRIREALQGAWRQEDVPAIRVLILRQLCRAPGGSGIKLARGLLSTKKGAKEYALAVRAEAAGCLGKAKPPAKEAAEVLRGLLSDSNHELIKGNACEALSRLGASADAVKVIAAQLGSLKLAHRCATALAALGSAEAYKALFDSTRAKLERGPISPQQVRALASFKGKGEELKGLLKEVSEAEVLTAETRAMARRELARLR